MKPFFPLLFVVLGSLVGCQVTPRETGMAYPRWKSIYQVVIINSLERSVNILDIQQDGKILYKDLPNGGVCVYDVPNWMIWERQPVIILVALPASDGAPPKVLAFEVRFDQGYREIQRQVPLILDQESLEGASQYHNYRMY